MKLSVSHNFAFLCNPKCGSSSVEKAIHPFCRTSLAGHPTLKHINAKTFHRHLLPILRKAGIDGRIETFCIMREPVERIFSWYRYQMRPQLKKADHPGHAKYTGGITFEEFVSGYLSENKPLASAKIGTQADFITLADGTPGVDRIFRLSNMASVEAYLSEKIGQQVTIPHRNASPDSSSKPSKPEGFLSVFSRKAAGPQAAAPASATGNDSVRTTPPMEISPGLLANLKAYLADDYRLYNDFSVQ